MRSVGAAASASTTGSVATARLLGLENEKELMGHGVSACATCDGFFFKDQHVMVVGGGDSAMEEAGFLTRFASQVTIIHRRDNFRASKIMAQRVLDNPKVDVMWNSTVSRMLGDAKNGGLTGVTLKDISNGSEKDHPIDGLFLAIGHRPNTELFKGQLDLDKKGYLVTEPKSSRTNIPGVFASGDVQDSVYRQAVTAAGTGCMAAIDAERFLEGSA